jgi:cyanophycinase
VKGGDPDAAPRNGHLVIIGGAEDRVDDKTVLTRFIELCGGADSKIVVITAASSVPDKMWDIYDEAFGELGVSNRRPVHIHARADADDADTAQQVAQADGIFMSGGDQKRLLAMIGGSSVGAALHHAARERGACIGGTSAGASAMSAHMLADGKAEPQPEKGAVTLGAGLGLAQHVIIDQHFTERHRLARLLSAVAQQPSLLGIGVDEDTALIVERGVGIEVTGHGAVTVVDGRDAMSNLADVGERGCLELIDVRLHLLPSGSRYRLAEAPAPLRHFLEIITQRTAQA